MARTILGWFAALVLCFWFSPNAQAQQASREVVFVNGIGNSLEDALTSLRELSQALADTPTRSANDRRVFRLWLQYNQVGWPAFLNSIPFSSTSEDFREMAVLKVAEECFLVDLRNIVVPFDNLRSIDLDAARNVRAWSENLLPGTPRSDGAPGLRCGENSLVSSGLVTAANVEPLRSVVYSLALNVQALGGAIVVAHSQGNLLANLAYASLAAELGNDVVRLMRVVNVANTSAVSVNALDATHGADGALGSLALLLGNAVQRMTPECGGSTLASCSFVLATPTLETQFFEHGFVDPYLSDQHGLVVESRGVPFTAGAERMVDRLIDLIYAAYTSLGMANGVVVNSVTCDSPIVGVTMSCTIAGTALPASTAFTATNCSPYTMAVVPGGSALQRQFACVPQAAGVPVVVSYAVPGYFGSLPTVPSLVALAPPVMPPNSATHPLNDTGAVTCVGLDPYSPFALPCTGAEAIAANSRQDGMIGRDVTLSAGGDGALGFSFEEVPTGTGTFFSRTDCVRDRVTDLVWEGKPSTGTRAANLTYRGTLFAPSADSAEAYVTYVNSVALCGFTDWRLPTIRELQSITHLGAPVGQAVVDGAWMPNTAAASYRTATGDSGGFRAGVDFTSGWSSSLSPFDYYRVRLVRGSSPSTLPRFVVSADGNEVFDQQTGLTWRRCMEGRVMGPNGCVSTGASVSLSQADALVLARAAGGNWRLPNIKELSSIMPLDVSVFPDLVLTNFSCWSSTISRTDAGSAWAAGTQSGDFFVQPRSLWNCARLVR